MKKREWPEQRKRCGVYMLTDGVDVIYVGVSRDVHRRVMQHAAVIDFSQVFVFDCEPEEFRVREAAAIKEFRPVLNEQNVYRGWLANSRGIGLLDEGLGKPEAFDAA